MKERYYPECIYKASEEKMPEHLSFNTSMLEMDMFMVSTSSKAAVLLGYYLEFDVCVCVFFSDYSQHLYYLIIIHGATHAKGDKLYL